MLDQDLLRRLTAKGLNRFEQAIADASDLLVPNPEIDIVEWIEGKWDGDVQVVPGHIVIPPEVSPTRPGAMRLTIVQKLIARQMQKDGVRRIAFLKSPRQGSTLFNVAILLFFACWKGVDVIFYERTDDDAQAFHDKKLYPIMMASPKIRAMMRPDGKQGVQDKWSDRILRNGAAVQLRSGFADGSARAIKGELLCVDEASSKEFQEAKVDGEGNKIEKIWRRAQEFAAPIMYVGGTPTNDGKCVVTEEYNKGDECVIEMLAECCGTYQEFVPDVQRVAGKDDRKGAGIRYTMSDDGQITEVWYECGNPDCRACIPETEKSPMLKTGRLRPTKTKGFDPRYSSVYAWLAYSEDPEGDWTAVARSHRDSVIDPSMRQPYYNLTLAKSYAHEAERTIPISELEKRAVDYGADCPAWATDVYYGWDAQQGGHMDPRMEGVFYAAGPDQRRAFIKRVIISHYDQIDPETGEVERVPCAPFTGPSMRAVWDEIDKPIVTADGRVLTPSRGACDVGWHMQEALAFVHHPESKKRRMIPVRGRKETGSRGTVLPSTVSTHFKSKLPFFMVGTQTVKDYLMETLKIPSGKAHSWDFPKEITLLGEDFYKQLLAEGLQETRPGNKVWMWDKIKPGDSNEVLDCTVYAYCAEQYDCKKNRVTKARLGLTIMPSVKPAENQGLDSITTPAQPVAAKDQVPADAGADPDTGGENVAPPAVEPERKFSINPRVVPRKQPVAAQPSAKSAPRTKSSRQSSLLAGW